jgi:hypothetical protein
VPASLADYVNPEPTAGDDVQSVFTTLDPVNELKTRRNLKLWGGLGAQALQWERTAWGGQWLADGVAITDRHLISSVHAGVGIGKQTFIDRNGEIFECYTTKKVDLPRTGSEDDHLRILLVDRDIPIQFQAPLCDPTTIGRMKTKLAVVKTNRYGQACIARLDGSYNPNERIAILRPYEEPYAQYYFNTVSGDSGSTAFIYDAGEFVYLTHITDKAAGGVYALGPVASKHLSDIDKAIATLGGDGAGKTYRVHVFNP